MRARIFLLPFHYVWFTLSCSQHQIIFPADIPIPKVQSFNHLWIVIEILYNHECLVVCYSHPVVKLRNHVLILQGECEHELWFHLHICLSNIIFWDYWLFSEFTLWRDGLPFPTCSLVRSAQEVQLIMLTVKGCLCCISRASTELILHNKLRWNDFEWFFRTIWIPDDVALASQVVAVQCWFRLIGCLEMWVR
jgi:hypothetical protein